MKCIIEKLAQKYFKYTGESPEYSFWTWLESMNIEKTEEALRNLYNDKELWESFN